MWIEEIKDKKTDKVIAYKFVERYFDDKRGKYRRVSTQLKTNSKQSENKATVILQQKIDMMKSDTSDIKEYTLGEMAKIYFEFKEPRWSTSTEENMKSTYRTHIKNEEIATYLISQITLKDAQSVLDKVQYDKGRSRRLTERVRHLIIGIINHAAYYYDNYNRTDFDLLDMKRNKPRKSKLFIDTNELPGVLKQIREIMTSFEADVLEVQALTGMRFGEVTALTKEDWDGETITINKAINARKKREVGDTKTYSSRRIIDTSQRINEIISHRIEINDKLFRGKSNLIFANTNNRPPLLDPINKKLKQINKDYTSHTMRHTHISMLAENNLPLKYVMNRVGHADGGTTLKIYTHVTDRMRDRGRNILDELLPLSCPSGDEEEE